MVIAVITGASSGMGRDSYGRLLKNIRSFRKYG